MRVLSPLAFLLLSSAAYADALSGASTVTAVTVYADAAQVTRSVTLTVPKGHHSLTVTDLPYAATAQGLRIDAPDGLTIGAIALRDARLTPADQPERDEVTAAKTALDAAREGLVSAETAVAALQAEVDAAEARAAFLGRVTAEAGPETGPEALKSIADTIGSETLTAKQAAVAAGAKLPAAEKLVQDAQDSVTRAEETLAALQPAGVDGKQLTATIDAAAEAQVTLTITHFVEGGYWRPAYDLSLTRGDAPKLVLDRGAFISQDTGEDWRGVDLTLSTATLSQQTEPSGLYPELVRIEPEMTEERSYASDEADYAAAPMVEAVASPAPAMVAETVASDDLVLYHFPQPVDVATGAEDLRIALDSVDLSPTVEARAVPAVDLTAYQVAKFTNPSDEVLISGDALLLRDGAVIGSTTLPRLAPGQEAEVGFGPIEGLRLKATQPDRAEGDSGVIVKSNRQETSVIYSVENLTSRDWTVRLLDSVPYAEQDDLEVAVTADPEPAETDVDGQKGIWAWSLDVAKGAKADVSVTETLSWPQGMVLQGSQY